MLNKLILVQIYLFTLLLSNAVLAAPEQKGRVQASLIIDANSQKILHAQNLNNPAYPASLTKLMTVYLAFEAMQKKTISPGAQITISEYAASARPSKLGLKVGEKIPFKQAIIVCIVKSANDIARALAEKVAGSEKKFVAMMNKKAQALGMKKTNFANASGWHHADQKTTVQDLAKLALALKRNFPEYYHLLGRTSFLHNGKTYNGHNRVVKNYEYADAGKTGYVAASGFNLFASASKHNKSLIGIIMGGKTAKERDAKMISLLDKHLNMASNDRSKSPKKKSRKIASADCVWANKNL